jgi:hypothetical protein
MSYGGGSVNGSPALRAASRREGGDVPAEHMRWFNAEAAASELAQGMR